MSTDRNEYVKGVLVLLALLIVGFSMAMCSHSSDALDAAKAELATAKDSLEVAKENATTAMARADSLQAVSERDSVERIVVVREIERELEVDLAEAEASEDTIRAFLAEVAPKLLPTLDRMALNLDSARVRTDSLLRIEQRAHNTTRVVLRSWREAALEQWRRAEVAEWALGRAEEALAIAEKRDINILGIRLDVTCGPGGGVGSKGPDAGVYCVVGR